MIDEVIDRLVRVGDLRLDGLVDLLAGDAAPGAAREAALLRGRKSLIDHAVDVGPDVELMRGERVVLAAVLDRDGLIERVDEVRPDLRARPIGVEATDVDSADRHAVGDRVLVGVVPPVNEHGRDDRREDDRED